MMFQELYPFVDQKLTNQDITELSQEHVFQILLMEMLKIKIIGLFVVTYFPVQRLIETDF